MVTNTKNGLLPCENILVSGEVIGPKERLLAEFDSVWHEVKHRNPDGHLYQHWQTSAHRIGTILAIELHRFLLLLECILLVGVFLIYLVYLWPQHTHLSAGEIALLGGGINNNLKYQGDNQQHHSH